MRRIAFTVSGVPTAKGRPKFARMGSNVRAYTPSKTVAAEQTLTARALPYKPSAPLSEPLRLYVEFTFPVPSSWSKKKQNSADAHVTKPDLDNLVKLVKDSLNGVFWIDDKQIYELTARKVYGPIPQTSIVILTAEPEAQSA